MALHVSFGRVRRVAGRQMATRRPYNTSAPPPLPPRLHILHLIFILLLNLFLFYVKKFCT